MWVQPMGQEEPWGRRRQPTAVSLPGESHGERSLAGHSPRGCKDSGMTEELNSNTDW